MQLYHCKVNLNGSTDNQVNLDNVTAAEIRLLQFIHGRSENGKEPVVEVEHIANTTRSDSQERARLLAKYAELELGKGPQIIEQLLGVAGVPLPQVYEPPVFVPVEDISTEEKPLDEVITPVTPTKIKSASPEIKRTRVVPKGADAIAEIAG